MLKFILLLFILSSYTLFGQQTKVYGTVWDANTGEKMPFVKVQFKNSKIGVYTDSVGFYSIETYYATDSLQFIFSGYLTFVSSVDLDKEQEINVKLTTRLSEIQEIVIRPPDELPSTRLHKRIIAHKEINNKEKLGSYEYESYNRLELDVNNIGDKFTERKIVQRLDLIMNYLDSAENGKTFLPILLTESISKFYFKNNPKLKRELVEATRVTGIENLDFSQFLGDMYFDINVYQNNINILGRSFVSPLSDVARGFYRFYLDDSLFVDNKWCYKMRFIPKRSGDLTFTGEMLVHDTTYAIKYISANISPNANINYVSDLYFEHYFDQVQKEVWMLTKEKMIVDINITKNSKTYGFFGRKLATRKDFVINASRPDEFYKTDNTVEFADSAKIRSREYWKLHRHEPLSESEQGIDNMIDSLNEVPFFKRLKDITYLLATGYYQLGKVELGDAFSAISFNPVEKFRASLALRTSNAFSRRLELSGKVAYGFGDEKFKYAASIRYNITPKKRGMLTTFYSKDIEQIGNSPTAASVGSTFGTLLRTGPLNKLTFVERVGFNLEKDIKRDLILFGGFEWKEYVPLGIANYLRWNEGTNSLDTIDKVRSSEFIARVRWTKDEEFIGGAFDRITLRSRYPIFSIQGIFAVKGLLGSNYEYQKIEFQMEHKRPIGVLGTIRYGLNAGYVFGSAGYPFLKVHEGSQTYWLQSNAFNKMNFFEFISDQYVGGFLENHWQGLFFDWIPLVKKLKLRLVSGGRITYGHLSDRHIKEMILPVDTKKFGKIPYAEASVGVENILKFFRVDVVWRLTHLDPGMNPIGVRVKWSINL